MQASTSSMQKPSARALPSLSARIDLDSEGGIGPGKIALLENIRECGSISAAGRAMNMSYKRAWDLVDEINRICRQAAVARQTRGKQRGGGAVTKDGPAPRRRGAKELGGVAQKNGKAKEGREPVETRTKNGGRSRH